MSLAEQLSEKLEQEVANTTPQTDEFGIVPPTPETPEYWVARALIIHNRGDEDDNGVFDVYCLHLRDGQLYLGHTPLKENKATFYELTHLRHSVKDWELTTFYRVLRSCLPKLSRRFIIAADNLMWDIERAEFVSYTEAKERIRNEEV